MKLLSRDELSKLSNIDFLVYLSDVINLFCKVVYPEDTHPFTRTAFDKTFAAIFRELFVRLHV